MTSIDRERLASVRSRHWPERAVYHPNEFGPGTICFRCQEAWPCDAIQLADAYEAAPGDPWSALTAELAAHQAWYRTWSPTMSAYVGVTDDGDFFGGAHIDGEDFDEVHTEGADYTSPEAVIAEVVRRMRQYRADRDRERAEDAASR